MCCVPHACAKMTDWSKMADSSQNWDRRPWDNSDTVLSKKMSQVLRHTAQYDGLKMTPDGYVLIRDMLHSKNFDGFTEEDVARVVENNVKQRFRLHEDDIGNRFVRANQGHGSRTTIADELLLTEVVDNINPREVCVHGTYWSCWEYIKHEGLKTMTRKHVHFASRLSESGEAISGMRSSCQILIFLNVPLFLSEGLKLYRSSNDVFLTRGLNGVIEPRFFDHVMQRTPWMKIWPVNDRIRKSRAPKAVPKAASVEKQRKPPVKIIPESWEDEVDDDDDQPQVEEEEERDLGKSRWSRHLQSTVAELSCSNPMQTADDIETSPEAAENVSATSAETFDAPDSGAGRWDRRSKPEKIGARSDDIRPQQNLQSPAKPTEKVAEKAAENTAQKTTEEATEEDAFPEVSLASVGKKDNTQDAKKELRKIRKVLREIRLLEGKTDLNEGQIKKMAMKANFQARLEELECISEKDRSSV